jgi:hypothetical protein
MARVLIGVFVILHGLVHALYTGQSLRIFELQPGMAWPECSWLLSRFLEPKAIRVIGAIALTATALIYIVGGVGLLFRQSWFKAITLVACVISTLLYLIFWDGASKHLDNQGAFGILINSAIAASLLLNWPNFDL